METESDEEDIQLQEHEQQQQHFHVLAVDDSLIDRKVLERLLRVSSYQVTCVESGNKALEYLGLVDNLDDSLARASSSSSKQLQQEGMKVNLIMTDYCMPGMSGYDLLRRVKGSSWKDVPVVVMSSENIPSRINMCLEGGAEEFLLKPLQMSDVEKLQPHILKTLDGRSCTCKIPENNNVNKVEPNKEADESKCINNVNNNNNNSKRKSMSPEPTERRSKMKEVAVYRLCNEDI